MCRQCSYPHGVDRPRVGDKVVDLPEMGLPMRRCGLPVTGLECQWRSVGVGADPPKSHWTAREGALHVNKSKYLCVGVGADPPKGHWTADEGALHVNWWC